MVCRRYFSGHPHPPPGWPGTLLGVEHVLRSRYEKRRFGVPHPIRHSGRTLNSRTMTRTTWTSALSYRDRLREDTLGNVACVEEGVQGCELVVDSAIFIHRLARGGSGDIRFRGGRRQGCRHTVFPATPASTLMITGIAVRTDVPDCGSNDLWSLRTLELTPLTPAVTRNCVPVTPCPQPCGKLTTPRRIPSVSSRRRSRNLQTTTPRRAFRRRGRCCPRLQGEPAVCIETFPSPARRCCASTNCSIAGHVVRKAPSRSQRLRVKPQRQLESLRWPAARVRDHRSAPGEPALPSRMACGAHRAVEVRVLRNRSRAGEPAVRRVSPAGVGTEAVPVRTGADHEVEQAFRTRPCSGADSSQQFLWITVVDNGMGVAHG